MEGLFLPEIKGKIEENFRRVEGSTRLGYSFREIISSTNRSAKKEMNISDLSSAS